MINYFNINPIALQLGPISIRWYGLMYLIGFYLISYLGNKKLKEKNNNFLTKAEFENLLFYGMLGAIFGGRLGYVIFYGFSYYIINPIKILSIWEGGMSFHGGMIGVALVIWVYTRYKKFSFFDISDFFVPIVPVALGIGRIGNFINGELWGRPTNLPWGMIFPLSNDYIVRHPSQLYESFLEGFILFILLKWFSKKPRKKGQITSIFLIGYGCLRFLVEFVRQPDHFLNSFPLGFSLGQLLSFPMITIGLVMYFKSKFQFSKS
ncbi:MAG: prolipoprotein diacylglyceryl transferase [Bordetella sp.]|nr:MAG: prolipoprotein diacylglyceryl transferase [Bordetella sp.]